MGEHIDTNDDGILSAEEGSAFKPQDVPLPSTPDAFIALLTRGEGTTVKAFSDFLTATVYYHPEIAEDDEPQGIEAEQLRSPKPKDRPNPKLYETNNIFLKCSFDGIASQPCVSDGTLMGWLVLYRFLLIFFVKHNKLKTHHPDRVFNESIKYSL